MEDTKNNNQPVEPENPPTELEICQKKADEYLNNWKRAAADMANYKKDEMERMAVMLKYAKEDLIEKVLPVFDSIYLSEKHSAQIKDHEWFKGFSQITKQIKDFLKKEGIEEIKTEGEKFDPNTMEIVQEVEGGELGIVAEESQKGYVMNGKVLRPAKVKVNK